MIAVNGTDIVGKAVSVPVTRAPPAALAISGTPAAATRGQAFSFTATVSGGTAPYTFAEGGTAPPAGLSGFSTTTGDLRHADWSRQHDQRYQGSQ